MSTAPVAEALAAVRARIAAAAERAGRDPQTVRLVAVTKGVTAERVRECITAGVEDIGENRVQEAAQKQPEVGTGTRWHLIGHLQTNKARLAAQLFDAVHSVDSERVARELARHRPVDAEPMAALLEVELTGLPGRAGVAERDAGGLLRTSAGLAGVQVMGLMTIAPPVRQPDDARAWFVRLRALRDRLQDDTGWQLPELSMGMTGDFEVAVEEGATMVRVGRALFGERG